MEIILEKIEGQLQNQLDNCSYEDLVSLMIGFNHPSALKRLPILDSIE